MELSNDDVWAAEKLFTANKKAGYLVETKAGATGRTYHSEEHVDGKVIVHIEGQEMNMLCTPSKLKVTGFID